MSCFDCKKMHPKCKAQCCCMVPIPKELYASHQDKIVRKPHDFVHTNDCVIPLTADTYYVFLNEDFSCNIYKDRPDICRKFGDESHPMLYCAVLDKNGKERCRQNRRHVERQTNSFISKLGLIK